MTAYRALDARAVLWSAGEHHWGDKPLIVLLHGRGAHEGDLFALSPALPLNAVVASVRATVPEGGGWSWFEPAPGTRGGTSREAQADASATAVLDWLDTLPFTRILTLGFSEGAAIATQLLRLAPERVAATAAISGYVVRGVHAGDERLAEVRPPLFWGRGTLDEVIPAAAIEHSAEWLPRHTRLTERIYEDVAHGISAAETRDIAAFLREHLR
ncbi:phospholipase/carboxylesterase [Diaminobutyricimonas aerilata]|uniref:Phospholipase/carboxylesterase n=1 Tax=Diaminobutyricimonas aerilata TaxID=1162967 RepID=A0A2M9CN46_9MICO|nr:phospholipase [Diaminobutyricimonas aerilata]PJJ73323.1 phospholipase/carboxylesterase [Diaminobutyricimonas aerilata]